ncbi:MAG: FkbM family methyltransferase [Shimia sp.]
MDRPLPPRSERAEFQRTEVEAPKLPRLTAIHSHRINGEMVHFAVGFPQDEVQKHHVRGEFYEAEECAALAAYVRPGDTFADIGANVGNHSIYVGRFTEVAKIIPVEMNPVAVALYQESMKRNNLSHIVDTRGLGLGIATHTSETWAINWREGNLGGGKLERNGGEMRAVRGDELFGEDRVDVIKMDVEGMEIAVLRGLPDVIARNRPVIMLEVNNGKRERFEAWVAENGYVTTERFKRYKVNETLVILPQEGRK